MDNRIKEFINLWVGKRLESLHCACEILDFGFSGDFVLHGMGLTRVILNDDISLSNGYCLNIQRIVREDS